MPVKVSAAGAAGDVLDVADRREAGRAVGGQVDGDRGRGRAIGQRIGVAEQVGGDRFDAGDGAACDRRQRGAVEDDIERVGAIGSEDAKGVGAGAAVARVCTVADRVVEDIVAVAAEQGVVARPPVMVSLPSPPSMTVGGGAAVEGVVAVLAEDLVRGGFAEDQVVAFPAAQDIGSALAVNLVAAAEAIDGIAPAPAKMKSSPAVPLMVSVPPSEMISSPTMPVAAESTVSVVPWSSV